MKSELNQPIIMEAYFIGVRHPNFATLMSWQFINQYWDNITIHISMSLFDFKSVNKTIGCYLSIPKYWLDLQHSCGNSM